MVCSQVRPIDGEGQVGVLRLEARDVVERGVLKLDQEFLTVVGGDDVDGEAHPLGLTAVHAYPQEVQEQLGRHGSHHIWTTGAG
jgi:hypothetical protein